MVEIALETIQTYKVVAVVELDQQEKILQVALLLVAMVDQD
jgi:2-keto-3-deoxy-6-phosphogluconate aldolase